jgi:hypothetical protein
MLQSGSKLPSVAATRKKKNCGCYSLEMQLSVGLEASFDNICDWKEIREEGEASSTKVYVTNGDLLLNSEGV